MTEPQIIRTPSGEEMVIIPRAEYEALIAAAHNEDEDDVAIYDARKAELAASRNGLLPQPVTEAMLKGDSLLRALRRWRDITQSDLAAKAGVGQGYISDLENCRRAGAPETLHRLARALDVPLQWLE
ncbi:helix-turn-helix domain-containing protein [Methylocapsa sp. S129]|uniref:helix-turn-helix domain-containing protein n=1 Tax=Methylocapsa sp. S129 TaxID=1641869 RepID=UPI00131E1F9B|nr:helix-turn-helix transcriptional regulator [Methylocapsa sp. S129]